MKNVFLSACVGFLSASSAYAQTQWYELRHDNKIAAYSCSQGAMITELDGKFCLNFGVEYNAGGKVSARSGELNGQYNNGGLAKACTPSMSGGRQVLYKDRQDLKQFYGSVGVADIENTIQFVMKQQSLESLKAEYAPNDLLFVPDSGANPNAVFIAPQSGFDVRGFPNGAERLTVRLVYPKDERYNETFNCLLSATQNIESN